MTSPPRNATRLRRRPAAHIAPSRAALAPWACALTLALALAPACTPRLGPRPAALLDNPPGQVWVAQPADLHVLQSTRFIFERDAYLLETRAELRDDMGDPLKAPGVFLIEVFPRQGRVDQRLLSWEVPVFSAQQQREQFDAITLAYRFQLKLDDDRLFDKPIRVRVSFGAYPPADDADQPPVARWIDDSLDLAPQARPQSAQVSNAPAPPDATSAELSSEATAEDATATTPASP